MKGNKRNLRPHHSKRVKASQKSMGKYKAWIKSVVSVFQASKPVLLMALIAVVLVISYFATPTFLGALFANYPITTIKVSGDFTHFDKQKLEAALADSVSEDYFSVDLLSIQNSIASLPWVESVWVKKAWPDTLMVTITERKAMAVWNDKQLLSYKKAIFVDPDNPHMGDHLPVFSGDKDSAGLMVDRYWQIRPLLAKQNLQITRLEISAKFFWRVHLNNDLVLVVDEDDCVKKIARFVALYQRMTEVDRMAIQQADLRYQNGLAIKWKQKDGNSDAA